MKVGVLNSFIGLSKYSYFQVTCLGVKPVESYLAHIQLWSTLLTQMEEKLNTLPLKTPIDQTRHTISSQCRQAAEQPSGLLRLKVSTGGGKTLSSRDSIRHFIAEGQKYVPITMLVNAAGVSPSQAPIETILKVDLYGTAVLLEEVGKVIAPGGSGVTISSQSGHRMPALPLQVDEQLACTPPDELLDLEALQPQNIKDTLHAYQLAKRCNEKRVMSEAVKWGERGARINSISPGIIVTPLAIDEFNGPRGAFYKNMFAKFPAGRPGAGLLISKATQ